VNTALRAAALAPTLVLASVCLAPTAHAATTVKDAEVRGSVVTIRGSGTAPNARILVNRGWLSGRADSNGSFTIESSTFTLPGNCLVRVRDGRTVSTAHLEGCTV
jgi:hypothetical protein